MSLFSSLFTRAKGVLEGAVSVVPIVGGAAAGLIDRIHTGDEHQDDSGNWVSNDTGAPTVSAQGAALQAEIDRTNALNKALLDQARAGLADTTARAGIAAAAKIGPAGNIYQQAVDFASENKIATLALILVVLFLVYSLLSD